MEESKYYELATDLTLEGVEEVLLGKIPASKEEKRKMAIAIKRKSALKYATGDKNLALTYLGWYDDDTQEAVIRGDKKISTFTVYNTVMPTAAEFDVFTTNEAIDPGMRNIPNGMLPAGVSIIVNRIQVMTAVSSVSTPADAKAALPGCSFGVPSAPMLNGEFDVNINKKDYAERQPNSVFDSSKELLKPGLWMLDSPFLLPAQTLIKLRFRLPSALPTKTVVRVALSGAYIV